MLFCSCDLNPDDYRREPNIYSFLSTDSTGIEVLTGKTAAVGDTVKIEVGYDTTWYIDPFTGDSSILCTNFFVRYPWNSVEDAKVTLTNEVNGFLFSGSSDSTGCFIVDSIQVQRGETWTLEVLYPEGDTVLAQTTIPDSFEVTYPEGDTIEEEDSLLWNSARGAAGYMVSVVKWCWRKGYDMAIVLADSISDISLYPGENCFRLSYIWYNWIEDADSIELYITAFDTNSYDYFRGGSMNIPGAWGMFGSATTIKTKRFVVKHPPPDTGGIPIY